MKFLHMNIGIMIALSTGPAMAQDWSGLPTLTPGAVRAENALWVENAPSQRFHSSRRVVVAELQGPGIITMIHFALPQDSIDKTKEYTLGRDLLLKMYWDGEDNPSVNVPLVDFFCDPAGLREQVNTALVNKRRGFNSYFSMPYRKAARIELDYDGPVEPGDRLWSMMPCYAYVMYRKVDRIGPDEGYLHAQWRQKSLLIGREDYTALRAEGQGKFVGWNVTIRCPGLPAFRGPGLPGYPVDMNEKFFIDGQDQPAIEFQGIEDAFGFSWGFPETENVFPLTGYWPFFQGAMTYRFFINDAISFDKNLNIDIGFGENEHPLFREEFSKPGSRIQMSSVCYWYQHEPHAAFPAMPPAAERAPAPDTRPWTDPIESPKNDGDSSE